MEDQQIDSFLAYISLIEEGSEQFSQEQVKKLALIRTKVGEILKKTQPPAQPVNCQAPSPISQASSVKIVESFEEFVEVNEMIKKRGNKWAVTDKKGKKTLGTHPTKKEAIGQLRAIEISKRG
jgi:hypothetical protein